ncbi:DUF3800 domain-containing protein [Rhizobium leguminosarum]|uniref:DUF3800 domain-containing protein n=1 Tax=Rhizobium leguminosarum TaxID=384 RepID=UPI001C98BC83|nr:DUF3800 domain-containing protein [Rhizobium leguminosarum]MBY5329938.1 DUF3800 domain-containing protein [Rhizobium leguminosarum]MBY5473984.1 DUF3800 domain-containing protein [Rhizobium leguminosarum]
MKGAIYADDSGNPGVESGSEFLPSARKSWTAVIVPTVVTGEVQKGMTIFLDGVRAEYGAEELHFTEIHSGKSVWKRISADKRAEVIKLMADLMAALGLPIVHQSIGDFTLLDHPADVFPAKAGDWDLKDYSQLALVILCSRLAHHLRAMKADSPEDFDLPCELYLDAGILPSGRVRRLPNWQDVIEGPTAQFRNSSELAGLQLADFAAFVINRSQWIAVTRERGAFSKAEELILTAAAGFNVLDFGYERIAAEDLGVESYEDRISKSRVEKGLAPRPVKRAVDV